MPKYTGATKPDDWLSDYSIAVHIAGGNKRLAVHYFRSCFRAPQVHGLTACWLSASTHGSTFKEAFIKNYTGTYKRPPRPRQLALCKQGPDESDCDYLTRWSELRNSCKVVGKEQTIGYFTDGCRDGTLMKHKLNRAEPKTMTEFMAIVDK
jgi:hypothetical protein